jgi:hypothetical protein
MAMSEEFADAFARWKLLSWVYLGWRAIRTARTDLAVSTEAKGETRRPS